MEHWRICYGLLHFVNDFEYKKQDMTNNATFLHYCIVQRIVDQISHDYVSCIPC